jgi:hypothetical protein
MESEYTELHENLYKFLQEAILISEKTANTQEVLRRKYRVDIVNGTETIVPYDGIHWDDFHLIGNLQVISSLKSYEKVITTCKKIEQISQYDGKVLSALGTDRTFLIKNLPIHFLGTIIYLEKGYNLQKSTFENIFSDFLTIFSVNHVSSAKIIVPINNIEVASPKINIEDDDFQLRQLDLNEIAKILNDHPSFEFFYQPKLHGWFNHIIELDVDFPWEFKDQLSGHEEAENLIKSFGISSWIRDRINQEIIVMRAILNVPISAQTYDIDYRGWLARNLGGQIYQLPWIRNYGHFSLSEESPKKYSKYRKEFLTIPNEKTKQRIFVAMRKLAFSMEKPYGGDEILDTISGLEGLLVNAKTEVSHQCAERAAILTEQDIEKRIELQRQLKDAYGLRSAVAHGDVVIDDHDSIISKRFTGQENDYNKNIEKFIRLQNLRTISRNSLHKAILCCIDKKTTKFDWEKAIMGTSINPY